MKSALSLRCPGWMSRVIVAWTLALAPLAALQAQTPDQAAATPKTLDTTWLTPKSVAVGFLRPRQVLTAEGAELLPLEIFAAAGMKYFGVDPIDIETVTVVVEPLLGKQPFYAAIVESTKPFEQSGLSPELTAHTEQAELQGKTYLKSRDPVRPSFYQLNDSTLIVASDPMLRKLLAQETGAKSSSLISEIKNRPATDDLYVAVDVKSLRPLITATLAAQAAEIPPEFQKYLDAPQLVRSAELAFNLSNTTPPALNVYADDKQAAQALMKLIDEGTAEVQAQMSVQMAMNPTDDPVEQALMAYSVRRTDATLEMLRPVRDGDKLTFFPVDPNAPEQSQFQQMAVIGILVALLLPAVQAAREAARRNDSLAHLRDFAIGMMNHHDTKGRYPAHASYSDDGKPLLSWRVHLLPYMEEQELYQEFHLDEPWDSEHNKQLIAKMPVIFDSASSPLDRSAGKTLFLAPVGEGHIFDGIKEGVKLARIPDGASKTIMIVEADPDKAVIWTKPDDLQVDPENPTAGLGKLRVGIFIAAFADGHAATISTAIDPEIIKALFTRNGGEVFQYEDLNP